MEASQHPKVQLLTCHDHTYIVYLNEYNRVVEISPIIKREEFLNAALLMLSISVPQFSDSLGVTFDNFKADFANNHRTPENTARNSLDPSENQSTSTQNGILRHPYNLRSLNNQHNDATKLDDSGDNGIECNDITLADLIKSRKDMTFIGNGACGDVFRIRINVNQ